MQVKSTDQMTRDEAKAKIIADFEENIAKLRACELQDEIYAWPNGLGVRFNVNNSECNACALWAATPADCVNRVFTNGNGEQARRVNRQAMIALEIVKCRELIETFAAM